MKRNVKASNNIRSRRGAVALEYILIAALVSIALIGAFVYFRRTLDKGVTKMTDVAGEAMAASVRESRKALSATDNPLGKLSSGGGQ